MDYDVYVRLIALKEDAELILQDYRIWDCLFPYEKQSVTRRAKEVLLEWQQYKLDKSTDNR
jgi:hypothetical protein